MSYIDRDKLKITPLEHIVEISYDGIVFLHARLRPHMSEADPENHFLDLLYNRSKAIIDGTDDYHQDLTDCNYAYITSPYLIPLAADRFAVCSGDGILGAVSKPIKKGTTRSLLNGDGFYGALYSLRLVEHERIMVLSGLKDLRSRFVQALNAGVTELMDLPELSRIQCALVAHSSLSVALTFRRLTLSKFAPTEEEYKIFFRLSTEHDLSTVLTHIQSQIGLTPERFVWV